MIQYLFFGVFIFLSVVVWEKESYQRQWRFIPSNAISHTLSYARLISEKCGTWVARIFSIIYMLSKFLPYVKPYTDSIYRIIVASLPTHIPGYYFVRGFFSEKYGKVAICVILATTCGYMFYLIDIDIIPHKLFDVFWVIFVTGGGSIIILSSISMFDRYPL